MENDKKERELRKQKRQQRKDKVIDALLTVGIIATGAFILNKITNGEVNINMVENNSTEEIESAKDIYNIADEYFTVSTDGKYKTMSCSKLTPITVAFADNLTEEDKIQTQYVIDYYNELFKTINPNYQFKVVDRKGAQIVIERSDALSSFIAMETTNTWILLDNEHLNHSVVKINNDLKLESAMFREYMAHEFLHITLCCEDIGTQNKGSLSILSYYDVDRLIKYMDNRTEKMGYDDNLVLLTPTDVSALICLYGSHDTREEIIDNYDLLIKTQKECEEVIGEETYYRYNDELELYEILQHYNFDSENIEDLDEYEFEITQ